MASTALSSTEILNKKQAQPTKPPPQKAKKKPGGASTAKGKSSSAPTYKIISDNSKARHKYTILDSIECGVILRGSEVKSLRGGIVQLVDAYARVIDGEMWLDGVHISPYRFAVGAGAHDPDRARKLLLHRSEIERLHDRVARERL